MAKKKKQEEQAPGSPAWMSTFSDLMNLLLCFFVLLFSMSSVDESKAEALIKSLADTFSIFDAGGSSLSDGILVNDGMTQLEELADFYDQAAQSSEETSAVNKNDTEAGSDNDLNEDNESNATANISSTPTPTPMGEKSSEGESTEGENTAGKTEQGENQGGENQGGDGEEGNNNSGESVSGEQQAGKTEVGENQAGPKEDENIADKGGIKDDQKISDKELSEALLEKNRSETEDLYSKIAEDADLNNLDDYLEISLDAKSFKFIQIIIQGAVLFDSGKAELKSEAVPVVSKLGDILSKYSEYDIEIIGHTDNVPMSKTNIYMTNEILSAARAVSVAQYLINVKMLNPQKITFAGRGEYDPIASNDTAEGRAKNRRVEIRIYNLSNSNN